MMLPQSRGLRHVLHGEQEQYNKEMADLQQLADQTLATAQQEAEAVVDHLQQSLADVQVHRPTDPWVHAHIYMYINPLWYRKYAEC